MEVKLTAQEASTLAFVLRALAVKNRTGELGIMHGMDRFVSANLILKKGERLELNSVAAKVGAEAIQTYRG
jgi:hypothetical protein